jgi:PAS domain S-box-containing protein
MVKKSKDEKLEQRVKDLEEEIYKRKRAEDALKDAKNNFKSLVEVLGDNFMIYSHRLDGTLTYVSPGIKSIFGISREDAIGSDWRKIIKWGLGNLETAGENVQNMVSGIEYKRAGMSFRPPYGKQRTVFISPHPVKNSKGSVVGVEGIVEDVTERKQAEEELKKHRDHLKELVAEQTKDLQKVNEELRAEISQRKHAEDALRESEAKYKSIFENVAISIMLIDTDGQILDINPYHINHIARGKARGKVLKENLLGQNLFAYPTVVAGGISKELKRVLEGKPVNIPDHYLPITSGGKPTYFNSRAVPLFLDGEVTGAVLIMEDITKFKQAELHIRDLSNQLMKSQERERQMISYELHDSVAQDLSSSRITCEMLLRYKSLTPGARKQISELSGTLHKVLKSVRDLSYELRPPGLEKLGLSHTMHQFCKDFSEKTGVRVDFQSAGIDDLNLSYETKINLYRLLQEGLNNVKKHADADNVQIRLVSSFPNIILRIDDDGKGFDLKEHLAKASSEKRMGLTSMANRVDLLLGRINIESIPGKGARILIEIPHKDENIRA